MMSSVLLRIVSLLVEFVKLVMWVAACIVIAVMLPVLVIVARIPDVSVSLRVRLSRVIVYAFMAGVSRCCSADDYVRICKMLVPLSVPVDLAVMLKKATEPKTFAIAALCGSQAGSLMTYIVAAAKPIVHVLAIVLVVVPSTVIISW